MVASAVTLSPTIVPDAPNETLKPTDAPVAVTEVDPRYVRPCVPGAGVE